MLNTSQAKNELIECLIKSEALAQSLKKSGKWYSILAIVLSIFLLFLRAKATKKSPQSEIDIWKPVRDSSYSNLLPYLIAQAKVETANFTSSLFLKHNNMFGMNCVRRRPNSQSGCTPKVFDGGMSKGIYIDPSKSAYDMVQWLRYNNFPKEVSNVDEYARLIVPKGFGQTVDGYAKAMRIWMN